MNYENRFVIFLDILGFGGIINSTVDKEGIDKVEEIDKLVKILNTYGSFFGSTETKSSLYNSKFVTQFSDSVVISFILDNPGDIIFLLEDTLQLLVSLTWEKFLCRGGVAYGKMIHTENIFFGPAFNEAYYLESKAALYPRVIISENVLLNSYNAYSNLPNLEKIDLYYGIQQIQDFLVKDLDGLYFIDYISKAQDVIDIRMLIEYYKRLKEISITGLNIKSEHLLVKYSWMKEKFNAFVKRAKGKKVIESLKEHKDNELLGLCRSLKYIS